MEKHYEVLMVEAGPLLRPSRLGTRKQRHVIEGTESKPKPCQFKWLRTAFHSFMEKHYKGLDGGSRTTASTINTGYQRATEAQTVSIQKTEDSLPFVFHGEAPRRSWWSKQDPCFHHQNWVPESNVMCLKGSSQSLNFATGSLLQTGLAFVCFTSDFSCKRTD